MKFNECKDTLLNRHVSLRLRLNCVCVCDIRSALFDNKLRFKIKIDGIHLPALLVSLKQHGM